MFSVFISSSILFQLYVFSFLIRWFYFIFFSSSSSQKKNEIIESSQYQILFFRNTSILISNKRCSSFYSFVLLFQISTNHSMDFNNVWFGFHFGGKTIDVKLGCVVCVCVCLCLCCIVQECLENLVISQQSKKKKPHVQNPCIFYGVKYIFFFLFFKVNEKKNWKKIRVDDDDRRRMKWTKKKP